MPWHLKSQSVNAACRDVILPLVISSMRLRLAQKLFLPTVCIAFPASFLGTLPAVAQAPPGPIASANFDPSDVYFQGYLLSRSAENRGAAAFDKRTR